MADVPKAPWELPPQGDTLMIVELSAVDGIPRLVTDPFRSDSVSPDGKSLVTVEPPLTFTSMEGVKSWLDENSIRGWKYLVVAAKSDHAGTNSPREALYKRQTARLHAMMEKQGYALHGSGSYEEGEYRRAADGRTITVQALMTAEWGKIPEMIR